MLTFRSGYFLLAILLFVTEILIAMFLHDSIIRPYGGDFLVVIMIYCFARALLRAAPLKVAIGVLLFAYCIETLQYFKIVDKLGLGDNLIFKTVIGYGFEWLDILAYTIGTFTVVILDYYSYKWFSK